MTRILRRAAAIGATLVAGLGAAHAAVLGVARIEITTTNGDYTQIAEVVAMSGGQDVALAATATASSMISDWDLAPASNAIDGNTGGDFYADGIYHGEFGDVLTISFNGATFDLDALTIYGRTDCCTERDVYTVKLFGIDGAVLFEQSNLAANGGAVSANIASAVPVPGAFLLFGPAIAGLAAARRRRA